MAQAYIRQSTFSDGDTITAALFNNEYNQLVNAFAYSSTSASNTGHRHDGTAGQGGNIFKIGDLDFLNKVEIDSTNNRVGFYVEVSSAAVEQLRIQDGALVPVTDNDIDLGTSSLEFKDAFFDGTVTTDALVADTADINGGTVDGATIGANSASTGAFTSVTTTGNVDVGGNLTVTGTTTFNGGTITMGDAADDNVVFGADVNSNIIPNTDNTYDLGSSSQEWKDLYVDGIAYLDGINFNGTAITATAAEINALDGITSTVSELNIVDGDTSATSTTLADADRVVVNDNGTMVQVALTDFETYFESALDTLSNVTTVGALNAGSITSGFGAIDNGSSAITTTGTITYGSLSDGTITITAFVDEDDMSSNSATLVPTQQSVKAYVDTQLTAEDLDVTTDSGTIAIDLDSETLTIGGTSNEIETSATGNAVTIGIPAAAQITTSLGIGGGSTNGVQISQGAISIKNGGTQSYIDFYCESSNAHYARLQAPAHSAFGGNITLTLPATTGTLALTSGDITGNAATATALATARTIHGVSFDGTANIDLTEVVQDTVGAMFSSNTETGIAATYEDGDGTIDLVIGSGVITNAMLAGSIANSKLANSSITVSDGSNSTATALGGTITFAGTSNEVEVAESSGTVTVGLPSNVTIGNNLTVTGDLTVSGTTTQTGPIVSDDNFTGLLNNNSANSSDFGFFGKYVESSTTKYAGLYFDASTDNTFRLFTDTQTEPAATVDTSATGYVAANLITAGITATTGTFSGAVSGTTGTFSGDLAVDTNVLKVDTSNNRIGVNQASPTVSIDAGSNTDAILVPVGTTAQRPTGAAGQFRYNSTTSQFEGYTSSWGAIAGGGGSGGSSSTFAKNTFTGDGSTTAFTLNTSMTNEDGLIVFIDGVYQADNVYSVSGTTLTFATAPVNSRVIEVFQLEGGIVGTAPTIDTMTGDGSDTTLALSTTPSSENQTFVTIDGVVQHKDTYAVSGSTLTFSAAPPTGTKVECVTFSNVAVTTFQDADGDTKIQVEESSDEDKIRFDTGGTERVIIDSTGVGIGTSSPTGKLEIAATGTNATPHIKLTESGDTREFNIYNDGSGNGRLVLADSDDDTSDTEIVLADNGILQFKTANSERMTIDASGNVGIGETSPTAGVKLHITNATQVNQYLESTGNTTNSIFQNGADGNSAYVFNRANLPLTFGTNNTERMRIDSSGNVGIGTSSPDAILETSASATGNTVGALLTNTNQSGTADSVSLNFGLGRTADGHIFSIPAIKLLKEQQWTSTGSTVDSALVFSTISNESTTEKMRILGNGQICFNSTEIATNSASCGFNPHSNQGAELFFTRPSSFSGTGNPILNYHGGTYIGGINTSTSATSFLTSSDYRLKENVNYEFDALSRIAQLKPARFNFIIEKNKTVDGFLAHEVSDIVPEAVTGEKDGEQIQAIDQSKLVPLLTKAIQEQQELIETLTARIETLEGGE
jgi:hypothetical protein